MTAANDVAEALLDLDTGDDVTLVLHGGVELFGTVEDDPYHAPSEQFADEPVPVPGYMSAHSHLDGDSADSLPSHHVSVKVNEQRPGRWDSAEASVHRPIYDDEDPSLIVDDEYDDLGEIVEVRR